METKTLRSWVERRGYEIAGDDARTLEVKLTADFATKRPLPHLFVQNTENWVVLSVLPVEIAPAYALVGLPHALLSFNRSIRVVKFALGGNDEVVLCAELPTESLDEGELLGAVDALLDALKKYGDYAPLATSG